MLLNIFKFYLLGLVIAFFVCLVIGAIWLGWRALRRAKIPNSNAHSHAPIRFAWIRQTFVAPILPTNAA